MFIMAGQPSEHIKSHSGFALQGKTEGRPEQAQRQTKSVWHCARMGQLFRLLRPRKAPIPYGGLFWASEKGGLEGEVGGGATISEPADHASSDHHST